MSTASIPFEVKKGLQMHHFQYAYCTLGLPHESFGPRKRHDRPFGGLSEVKIAPNHSDFSKLRNAQIHKSSLTFVIAPQYSFKATVSNFNGKVS